MEQPSMASPEELLSLLQNSSASEQTPELRNLMDVVQRMQGGKPSAPTTDSDQALVFPEPGFVIKTMDEQGVKVFINVCGSPKVSMPGGWTQGKVPEEVRRHLETSRGSNSLEAEGEGEQAAELLRFPLSMGAPREDQDHRGEHCAVVDCVLNSDILRHAGLYRPLKVFLVQLAMGWAQQKTGMQLDPQYKLPKMRYKGDTPHPQYIRLDAAEQAQQAKQLISEVEDDSPAFPLLAAGSKRPAVPQGLARGRDGVACVAAEAPAMEQQLLQPASAAATAAVPSRSAAAAGSAAGHSVRVRGSAGAAASPSTGQGAAAGAGAQQAQRSQQLQYTVEYIGRPLKAVQLAVQLPPQAAALFAGSSAGVQPPEHNLGSGVAVDVAGHVVHVEVPGCQTLAVELPLAVAADGASAQMVPGAQELLVRLPFLPFRNICNQLKQSAPHTFGALGISSDSLMELD